MKTAYHDRTEWRNERGRLHRLDGPARIYTEGTKQWIIDGKYHREDGPAIELSNGDKHFFLNGNYFSEQEWFNALSLDRQFAYLFKLGEE